MARISTITLKQQASLHTLTVRKTIDFMKDFSNFAEYAFDKILKHLEEIKTLPSDAPIVCFHNMDLANLDVEIGFPTAETANGKDDITANIISSQKVVTAIDLGPYEKQDPTLEELFAWIQANNYEMQGKIYYQYLNDTERSESELLTKMIIPIREALL